MSASVTDEVWGVKNFLGSQPFPGEPPVCLSTLLLEWPQVSGQVSTAVGWGGVGCHAALQLPGSSRDGWGPGVTGGCLPESLPELKGVADFGA